MIILNGKRIDGTVGDALPIGTLSPFVGLVAPKGYLLCQGQLVDKAKYPELWDLCGDTFGQSTTTQFYLPDLQNKVIGGYKPNDDIFGTFGASIGAKSIATGNHTLTAAELPEIIFDIPHVCYGEQSTKAIKNISLAVNGGTAQTTGNGWEGASNTDIGTRYGHRFTIGGDGAHNHGNVTVVQPTIVLNWIIKAFTIVPNQSEVVNIISQSNIDVYSANFVNSLLDQMKQEAFDFAHPVGSYYETSDANFNPSNAGWYGTWVQDTKGQTTVSKSDSGIFSTLGADVGAESKDISHTHSLSNSGYAKITGWSADGALTYLEVGGITNWTSTYRLNASSTGGSNKDSTYGAGLGGSTDNKSLSCNVIQPSKVVIRWHRIA